MNTTSTSFRRFLLATGILAMAGKGFAQVLTLTSAPHQNWRSIASSADGVKLVAVASDGPTYTSPDGGWTWVSNNVPPGNWQSVACSANGSKLVAAAGASGYIFTSSNFGATWESNSVVPNANWVSVASSADGVKLVAVNTSDETGYGSIYGSTDSGATWVRLNAPTNYWLSVASSADGTKVTAGCEPDSNDRIVYASTNSGARWAATDLPAFSDPGTRNFRVSIATSANGTVEAVAISRSGIFAGTIGHVYLSKDAGASWIEASSQTDAAWNIVALSADGATIVAGTALGAVFVSRDAVTTWDQIALGYLTFSAFALSADGKRFFATDDFGAIYSSENLTPWRPASVPRTYFGQITSSADGNKLAVPADYSVIFTSSDSGATWTHTSSPSNSWAGIASSADGADASIKLWVVYPHGLTLKTTLHGHKGYIDGVTFSPDGTRLVSSAGDQTLKLWGPTQGAEVATLYGHSDYLYTVKFARDGNTIYSSGFLADNTTRFWAAPPLDQLETRPRSAAPVP